MMLRLLAVFCVICASATIQIAGGQEIESPAQSARMNLQRMNQSVTAGEFKIARAYMTDQGATEVIGDIATIAISLADPSINESFPAEFDNFKKEFKAILESAQLTTNWEALNSDAAQFKKFQSLAENDEGLMVLGKLLNAAAAMPWNGFQFRGNAVRAYEVDDKVFIAIEPAAEKEFGESGQTAVYRFIAQEGMWKFDGVSEPESEAFNKKLASMPPTLKDASFEGETADGQKISYADYQGKVVLFDFWGTWCAPCVAKLPKLEKIHTAFHGHGFEIIGFAQDDAETLNEFYKKKSLPWKNVIDPDSVFEKKFGIKAYPTTMLINKDGNHIRSNLEEDELVDELVKLFGLDDADFAGLKKELAKKPNQK